MSIAQEQEIARLKRELDDLRTRETIRWVGETLGQALATQLAAKPWKDWTEQQKQTLTNVCWNATTALEMYKERLPKGGA